MQKCRAQAPGNASGLPIPRFASLRSQPINVRVGPGTRYDVAWIFKKAGLPVEIIQEFDTWRKIRDFEGAEGWVHQNLLSGRRTVLVTPWTSEGRTALRARPDSGAAVRAWLGPAYLVKIDKCDTTWCAVRLTGDDGRNFSGYVGQAALWGVYQDETVN